MTLGPLGMTCLRRHTRNSLVCILVAAIAVGPAQATGKIGGHAGGATAWTAGSGLEMWSAGSNGGWYELSLDSGEYAVTLDWKYAPRIPVRDGQTTLLDGTDDPKISMEMDVWASPCLSYGQTYTATGTSLAAVAFRMFGGRTVIKLSVREGGPQGRLIGEITTSDRRQGDTYIVASAGQFPTTPGKTYYIELSSTEGIPWNVSMPRGLDPYSGGIAYFDGVPHPESDLGIRIDEVMPGLVKFASAEVDQHFIKEGPGSGFCTVAGQTFVPGDCRNIISVYANVGFSGYYLADFIYTVYEDGPGGKPLVSKLVNVHVDWGATAYLQPDEVMLKPGTQYYLEYKRADGQPFYSYLSADVYPDGKAYRDGREVEGFDQFFRIEGEVEPGGVTYPYNVKLTDVTPNSAKITWETSTKADGIVYLGEDQRVQHSVTANADLSNAHSVVLTGLKPASVYYYRVTSCTGKKWAARTYGRLVQFVTPPVGEDKPQFDRPEPVTPVPSLGPRNVPVANSGFEDGLKGWKVCWKSDFRNAGDYKIPAGPYGRVTANDDGYKPHSGRGMYGWHHLKVDDPKSPGEVWKQDLIHQRVKVKAGHHYVLKAWVITADRNSSWGADCRVKLLVDAGDTGALDTIETAGKAPATQWFCTQCEWKQIYLHFTAEKDTADIGVQILEWYVHDACYLYVDDVSVEEAAEE